jgi:hypothetical protein
MHRERVITAFPDSQVHISKVMRFNLRKIEANKASQNAIVLAYSSSWRNPVACSSSSHLISDRAIYISVSPLATYRHFQSADLERTRCEKRHALIHDRLADPEVIIDPLLNTRCFAELVWLYTGTVSPRVSRVFIYSVGVEDRFWKLRCLGRVRRRERT